MIGLPDQIRIHDPAVLLPGLGAATVDFIRHLLEAAAIAAGDDTAKGRAAGAAGGAGVAGGEDGAGGSGGSGGGTGAELRVRRRRLRALGAHRRAHCGTAARAHWRGLPSALCVEPAMARACSEHSVVWILQASPAAAVTSSKDGEEYHARATVNQDHV